MLLLNIRPALKRNVFMHKKQKGFTLVELSIVIVIIGLIVAGIIGGQTLVRQAKIRALISDYNKYTAAINAFNLEYDGIPGDLSNANAFGIGTDGNGDKIINSQYTESWYSWQHLSNSGLIPGSYTGADAGTIDYQIGTNVPGSSFGNGVAVHLSHIGVGLNCLLVSSFPLFGVIDDINVITFAKPRTSSDGCPSDPFLKVAEAHGIDNKLDDGHPDSGILYSANKDDTNFNGNRCVDNNVRNTGGASYDFNERGESCRILFKL